MAELDIDTFGEIMDKFMEDNPIQMLIEMPEGTIEPEIADNARMGSVIQFYILLHALEKVASEMIKVQLKGMLDPTKTGDMIDGMLGLVKISIMSRLEQNGIIRNKQEGAGIEDAGYSHCVNAAGKECAVPKE